MSYINNGIFNHAKWQRDQLSEGPGNDPLLKSLRTRVSGEKFPDLKVWWEYEPNDIMTYVYWHQGQLPPTGPKFDKEWNSIVKQLHAKYPIPADALPELDVDAHTERALSVDAPDMNEDIAEYSFQAGDMWSEDFDYVGMLTAGTEATYEMGYEHLTKLYDSFTDVNYHTEAADLGNALEWMEDMRGIEDEEKVKGFLESFRNACAKTLKDITRR